MGRMKMVEGDFGGDGVRLGVGGGRKEALISIHTDLQAMIYTLTREGVPNEVTDKLIEITEKVCNLISTEYQVGYGDY